MSDILAASAITCPDASGPDPNRQDGSQLVDLGGVPILQALTRSSNSRTSQQAARALANMGVSVDPEHC